MKKILNWYTKESFLYVLINNCLRLATMDSILYCRFALSEIQRAIKEGFENQKSERFNGVLYRAAFISDKEWLLLQQNIGKDIEMHGFLSTTKNLKVAEMFAGKNSKKVLIIVPPAPDHGEQGFIDLAKISTFEEEEEILFNVRSRFTVLEADVLKENRSLVLLYGSQEMKIYTKINDPILEVVIPSLITLNCRECKSIITECNKSTFYVDLFHVGEYVCHNCFETYPDDNKSTFICLSLCNNRLMELKGSENIKITIEGLMMKYAGSMDIPFYGYKCGDCKEKTYKKYYKCLDCEEKGRLICRKCFVGDNNCREQGHLMIIESNPFSSWHEKITQRELDHREYQKQLNQENDHILKMNEIFQNTEIYKKQVNFCERILFEIDNNVDKSKQLPNFTNRKKSLMLTFISFAYNELGEFKKAIEFSTDITQRLLQLV